MKKPSLAASVIKVFVGLLFLIMAFDMDDSTIAVCLVLGLAFLAWAFLPYRRFQREMQDAQAGRGKPGQKAGNWRHDCQSRFWCDIFHHGIRHG